MKLKKLPTVCGSLREAMQNLDKDRKFLTEGGVFTDDQIDAYIELNSKKSTNSNIHPTLSNLKCIIVVKL